MKGNDWLRYGALAVVAGLLSSCGSTPDKPITVPQPPVSGEPLYRLGSPIPVKNDSTVQLYPTDFAYLPGWLQDDHAAAFSAFRRSCDSWRAQPDDKPLGGIYALGQVADWKRLCQIPVRHGDEKQFFEQWFKPYAVASSGHFDGLFTGYYLPELHGSFKKSARYRVPIYGVPKDLVKHNGQLGRWVNGQLQPYFDRAAIQAGALAGKGAELLWVDSEVDAFFMEVQGSGRVMLEDGRVQAVNYAGKNGRSYYAIGKTLVDQGVIAKDAISMQTIRAWILQHPQEGQRLMQQNQSVVFFKLSDAPASEGPIGSMNAPLTAGYSLAVDKQYLPMGVPLWLDAEHPEGNLRLRRLVMAQDTGGAIKGVIRGDVYWGQGDLAGERAGVMKSKGRFFLLVPRHLAVG